MKPCVCCNRSTIEWLTLKNEKAILNFHLSKDMERQEYDGDRRFYLLYVCFSCQEQVKEGKAIKEIRYSNLLHKAAKIAFTV